MPSEAISINPLRANLYAALESEHGSAYVLGPDLSIQYVNEGWRRFALENGAPECASGVCIGRPVTSFFEPGLREIFGARFRRVLERNEAWCHIYECSSPALYRKFNMRAVPTVQSDGVIVIHSLVVEAKVGESARGLADKEALYTDARGLIVQCSGCGRVHQPSAASWDWAPGLVGSERKNVSHGICTTCDFQYYGQNE